MGKSTLEGFAVEKVSLPHFEVDEHPKTLRVIRGASHMFLHETLQEIRLDKAPRDAWAATHKRVSERGRG